MGVNPLKEDFLLTVLVVTKSTPDTAAKIEVDAAGVVKLSGVPMVMNPWDEYSVTEAVLLKEAHKVKTVALAVGPELHNDSLKDALAIGIDEAVRVWDAGMEGQDSLGYARAIAAAVKKLGDIKLIIFGRELSDMASDAHIFRAARLLGWPVLGSVSKIVAIDFAAGTIKVERAVEEGKVIATSKLPVVISVLKDINSPKAKSFMGIKKASKAVIPVWSSADLGLGEAASKAAAATEFVTYSNPPVRAGKVEIIEGATDREKAEKLVAKLLEEKVI